MYQSYYRYYCQIDDSTTIWDQPLPVANCLRYEIMIHGLIVSNLPFQKPCLNSKLSITLVEQCIRRPFRFVNRVKLLFCKQQRWEFPRRKTVPGTCIYLKCNQYLNINQLTLVSIVFFFPQLHNASDISEISMVSYQTKFIHITKTSHCKLNPN